MPLHAAKTSTQAPIIPLLQTAKGNMGLYIKKQLREQGRSAPAKSRTRFFGQRQGESLPLCCHTGRKREETRFCRKNKDLQMMGIKKLFDGRLHHPVLDYEMMHLLHLAAFVLSIMMLSMLIIQTSVLTTHLHNHTDTLIMMMMKHHRREKHTHRGNPNGEYV